MSDKRAERCISVMGKRILPALGAALVLALAPVASAQAATDISLPGSCQLSAHWPVYTSANFNNTHGSPSRGYLDYLVVRSPGGVSATWSARGTSGQFIGSGFFYFVKQDSAGDYIYRANPAAMDNVRKAEITVRGGTGECLSGIYSQN